MMSQSLGRLTPWLLLALASITCPAGAGHDYTLSIQPAWGGYVKPGVPSELNVRLLAPQGGHGRLRVHGSRAIVSADVLFEAGLPLQMHLPLAHDTAQPVAVELQIDELIVRRQSRELHVLPASASVVAVVSPEAPVDWPAKNLSPADATVLYLNASELPHTGQAYQLLSALFLNESALQAMSSTQRQALAEYTAGCGVLYLTGMATAEAQALRAMAGCGARNLIVPAQGNAAVTTPEIVSQPPAGATLGQLVPAGHDTVLRSIVVFLVGYGIALLFGARSATTASTLLLLPPAATALAIVAWTLASPRVQVASLAQMDSGDPLARFASLLQVTGTAPREIVLGLPAQLGLPSSAQHGPATTIEIDPAAHRFNLRLDARLMSRHTFRMEGITRGPALELQSTATGVRVTNHGDTRSVSAVLAWRGQRYTVPELAAGQQWSQPDEAQNWGHTAPEQVLRQRATDGGSWLLLPFDIPALKSLAGENDSAGWLLVRGVADA